MERKGGGGGGECFQSNQNVGGGRKEGGLWYTIGRKGREREREEGGRKLDDTLS